MGGLVMPETLRLRCMLLQVKLHTGFVGDRAYRMLGAIHRLQTCTRRASVPSHNSPLDATWELYRLNMRHWKLLTLFRLARASRLKGRRWCEGSRFSYVFLSLRFVSVKVYSTYEKQASTRKKSYKCPKLQSAYNQQRGVTHLRATSIYGV